MFYIINYWTRWILSWPDLILERIVLLFVSKTLIKKLLEALFHLMTHLVKYPNKLGEDPGRSNGIYTVILQSSAYLSNNKEVINKDSRELTRDRRLENRARKQNTFPWNFYVSFQKLFLWYWSSSIERYHATPKSPHGYQEFTESRGCWVTDRAIHCFAKFIGSHKNDIDTKLTKKRLIW